MHVTNLMVMYLYAGPSDAPLAPTSFEAFVKVPKYLRPHTQIYCTRYINSLGLCVSHDKRGD